MTEQPPSSSLSRPLPSRLSTACSPTASTSPGSSASIRVAPEAGLPRRRIYTGPPGAAPPGAGRRWGDGAAGGRRGPVPACQLSAVLLAGLLLNAALGWSWADPAAALLIAAAAIREGTSAWQGKGCCAASAAAARTPARAGTAQAEECGCRPGCQCQAPARSPVCCTMPAVPGHGRLGRAARLNRSSDRCSAFIASHTLLAQGRDSSVQENGTQQ